MCPLKLKPIFCLVIDYTSHTISSIFFSKFIRPEIKIYVNGSHRRTGRGSEGGCSPPNFGQLRFFGQQEKIWAKPVFKDVSMSFFIIFMR